MVAGFVRIQKSVKKQLRKLTRPDVLRHLLRVQSSGFLLDEAIVAC